MGDERLLRRRPQRLTRAEWILDGAPALDLSEISTARYAGRDPDETELRERCRQAYATHYRAGGETSAAS